MRFEVDVLTDEGGVVGVDYCVECLREGGPAACWVGTKQLAVGGRFYREKVGVEGF